MLPFDPWRSSLPAVLRYLFLLLVLLAAIWWIRGALARFDRDDEPAPRSRSRARPAVAERMLECSHCGLIVPESEGVREQEQFYCCAAHRSAGPHKH